MRLITLVAALCLAGCVSTPYDELLDNRYMEQSAEPVPQGIVGAWTGAGGPYLVTMIIQPDGTGVSCQTWHKHNSVSRVKYSNGVLYFSDGASAQVVVAGDSLILSVKGSPTPHRFVRDDGLKEAAPYCQKELS